LHEGEAANRAVYRFSDIGKHFGWFHVMLVSNCLRVAKSP
jgi:hypothetical protein